jgi:hypothetical protein
MKKVFFIFFLSWSIQADPLTNVRLTRFDFQDLRVSCSFWKSRCEVRNAQKELLGFSEKKGSFFQIHDLTSNQVFVLRKPKALTSKAIQGEDFFYWEKDRLVFCLRAYEEKSQVSVFSFLKNDLQMNCPELRICSVLSVAIRRKSCLKKGFCVSIGVAFAGLASAFLVKAMPSHSAVSDLSRAPSDVSTLIESESSFLSRRSFSDSFHSAVSDLSRAPSDVPTLIESESSFF